MCICPYFDSKAVSHKSASVVVTLCDSFVLWTFVVFVQPPLTVPAQALNLSKAHSSAPHPVLSTANRPPLAKKIRGGGLKEIQDTDLS